MPRSLDTVDFVLIRSDHTNSISTSSPLRFADLEVRALRFQNHTLLCGYMICKAMRSAAMMNTTLIGAECALVCTRDKGP
jgi:hypothetical protein